MRSRREAVVVATARTGMAKSFRGSFNLTRPDDMAAECIKHVMKKVPQLDPNEIEDVVMGTGFPEGPQGFNVGRNVAVHGGAAGHGPGPDGEPLLLVRPQAVAAAAHMVENEGAEAVIGGGLESITMMQNDFNKHNLFNPWLMDHKSDDLHADGADRRDRRRALQGEPREAGRAGAGIAAAHRRGAEVGQVQGRDLPDDGQDGGHRQGDRREVAEAGRRSTATSATAPTRRSRACQAAAARSRRAAASPPATRRSSPTAPRPT